MLRAPSQGPKQGHFNLLAKVSSDVYLDPMKHPNPEEEA